MKAKISDYIDAARERAGLESDLKLARELRITRQVVAAWRVGDTLPGERSMIKLADMAGVPRVVALWDLAIWRALRHDSQEAADALSDARAALVAGQAPGTSLH